MFSKIFFAALPTIFAIAAGRPAESANGIGLMERQGSDQTLNVVWSGEVWETNFAAPYGDRGPTVSFNEGIALLDATGNTLWSAADNSGYAVCNQYGSAMYLYSDCLETPLLLTCASNFAGAPGSCEVLQGIGAVDGCEDANSGVAYTVLTAGNAGSCAVQVKTGPGDAGACVPGSSFTAEKRVDASVDCNPCPSCS